MTVVSRRACLVAVVLSACLGACTCERPASAENAPAPGVKESGRPRKGGMDVTFLVTADTHFGVGVSDQDPSSRRAVEDAQGIEKHQLDAIRAMNAIAQRPFPSYAGMRVGRPVGVLVAGDLTDTGHPAEWRRFVQFFGRDGTDGLLRYPVFETWGNHDKNHGWYVRKQIEQRHGHVRYTLDWQDLHVICLGEAPDDDDLVWLERDLRSVGTDVGIVVYMHYPLSGPFSDNNWFGNGTYRARLGDVLTPYRVLGIFHGHYHASTRYRWRGIDVYNVGSAKHEYYSFGVVRVTDDRMVVGSWDYEQNGWGWVHAKGI